MMKVVRGFYSVAHSVKLCRPDVICAYPITPQSEIVENIAQMYANGELGNCEYITAESEFGAASILVGASATGARTYTATCSQGLILMSEVLWCAAGMRLPIVLTIANRSLSAPLSIWNDHQDSMAMRDAGIIQMYVENNQEVHDMMPQAFKIAENHKVMLPMMVCMDGYKLTHAYEPVDLLDQEMVDEFLPPYDPPVKMTTKDPYTFGSYATPASYMEFRAAVYRAMDRSRKIIEDVYKEWAEVSGRNWGGHIVAESCEDADVCVMAMGSLVGLVREVAREMREEGKKVGFIKIRTFRPFPAKEIAKAVDGAEKVIVFERSLSMGSDAPVTLDVKAAIHKKAIDVYSPVVGLGGRDVPHQLVKSIIEEVMENKVDPGTYFRGLKDCEEVIV